MSVFRLFWELAKFLPTPSVVLNVSLSYVLNFIRVFQDFFARTISPIPSDILWIDGEETLL